MREIVSHAGPKALEAANRRLHEIQAYQRGDAVTVTARSIQNWLAAFRRAEVKYGCGYFGLLDKVRERGNRNARDPDASRQLLIEYLSTHYAAPLAKWAAEEYGLYQEECTKQGIPPVGERTFYRERVRFEDQDVTMMQLQARLQAFIEFRVKHPRLEEINHPLIQAIYGHRSYTLLPLYGASGVGKSTVLKHVATRFRAEETEPSCVPVVEVQASLMTLVLLHGSITIVRFSYNCVGMMP